MNEIPEGEMQSQHVIQQQAERIAELEAALEEALEWKETFKRGASECTDTLEEMRKVMAVLKADNRELKRLHDECEDRRGKEVADVFELVQQRDRLAELLQEHLDPSASMTFKEVTAWHEDFLRRSAEILKELNHDKT